MTYDTTAATNRYELSIFGQQYTLTANGTSVLTGPVRNYSSFGFPYTTANFIFLGDDTSSAAAQIDLARVSVSLFPHINSMSLITNSVLLSLSNLETGVTFDIQQNGNLSTTNWTTVDSLTRTGAVTGWSGTINPNVTNAFFRIRVE